MTDAAPSRAGSRFTTSDGVTLVYDDTHSDSGPQPDAQPDTEAAFPPLLCLSGLSRNAQDFDYVLPHLKGRVIRLDYRGRGRSDRANPATYAVPVEARDVLELLDHLGLDRVAILGTSRGGLIAMVLAATAPHRLAGVCLNDIGPELAPKGLQDIRTYIGINPAQTDMDDLARARARIAGGFSGVPHARWLDEVRHNYRQDDDQDGGQDGGQDGNQDGNRLVIDYDPRLRDAVLANLDTPVDMWPLFDKLAGLPLALIRGANSDLLSPETASEMRRRRPDMIFTQVPDRGHVPFLDEPEALAAIAKFQEATRWT